MKGRLVVVQGAMFSLVVLGLALGPSIAAGPDVTPPEGLRFPDGGAPFIGPDGSVLRQDLQPLTELQSRPLFIDPDGAVIRDSLAVAVGLLTRPLFIDPDGSVAISQLTVAPGLLMRELFISPDGAVAVPVLDPPPGLNARPVFIGPDGAPIEDPVLAVPGGPVPGWTVQMRGVFPNPFNPSTELSFELRLDSYVEVTVHDLRGHLLRTLFQGDLAADLHVMRWDGKDDHGVSVATGNYLFRVSAEGETVTTKGSLLK